MGLIKINGLIAAVALGALLATGTAAASAIPQIDFRDSTFNHNNKHSFGYSGTVGGIDYDFTVSAFNVDAAGTSTPGKLWWDANDGLGILGNEDDEIGKGQYLQIDFSSQVPLSHLFFADLFVNETWRGNTYDEAGILKTDDGEGGGLEEHRLEEHPFRADDPSGFWGNADNGEYMLAFEELLLVESLQLWAPDEEGANHNFALLGLTDPHEEGHEDATADQQPNAVPAPGALATLIAGLLAMAGGRLTTRRRRAA